MLCGYNPGGHRRVDYSEQCVPVTVRVCVCVCVYKNNFCLSVIGSGYPVGTRDDDDLIKAILN